MGRILDRYYPATVCYYIWTATYADKSADTNIDGNDVYVTNTDEITFDDTIRGKQISTCTDADEVHPDHNGANFHSAIELPEAARRQVQESNV